ncbi:MAG: type I-U CRISPR-associated RAMP protein Csb1/Cas7u [Vulcanimicrobiaceae bacterium]
MTVLPDLTKATARILIECDLRPVQGERFQPTGFPSLGAAEFQTSTGTSLLVESAQSLANRLEAVAWDDAREDLVAALDKLPYVAAVVDGRATDSIREAHRLNSPYLIQGLKLKTDFLARAEIAGQKAKGKAAKAEEADESSGVDIRKLAAAVFRFDPNSVLHGVFLEKIIGLARLTRVLSGFIEADGVRPAQSGGVKNDRIDPKGQSKGGAEKGFGNVPFARTEYTADKITAYFSLDTALLASYGLGDDAERLLIGLGLWKVRRFLEVGGRVRTACDLDVREIKVTRPVDFELPATAELEGIVREQIARCTQLGLFAVPPKTIVPYPAE